MRERQTDRQIDRHKPRQPLTHTQRDKQRERERETERDKETQRQRDRDKVLCLYG